MILIDTGYLLGLLCPSDELHQRAVAWSASLNARLLVTEYVVLETVNALKHPTMRPRVHQVLDHIFSDTAYEFVMVDRELLSEALRLHRERPDKYWSLTDCVSFILMWQRGLEQALAYDEHFEQAGFDPLLRRDPR